MSMTTQPILLFSGDCAVCTRIAGWVRNATQSIAGPNGLVVRPIGNDPLALSAMNPALDIWAAYETIHVLMPGGGMKLGGEAVAEVLRRVPRCRWFAWIFSVRVFRWRPFQSLLNLAYLILADARPLLGCDSCGIPSRWVRLVRKLFGSGRAKHRTEKVHHFTPSPRHLLA